MLQSMAILKVILFMSILGLKTITCGHDHLVLRRNPLFATLKNETTITEFPRNTLIHH